MQEIGDSFFLITFFLLVAFDVFKEQRESESRQLVHEPRLHLTIDTSRVRVPGLGNRVGGVEHATLSWVEVSCVVVTMLLHITVLIAHKT